MFDLILGFATEVLKFVNNQSMKSRADKMKDIQQGINDEKAKGANCDDGKVERLEQEFILESNALLTELAEAGAHK